MKILVINCGSSSLKYQLIDMENESVMAKGLCERIGIEGSKLTHKAEGKELVIEQPMPEHTEAITLVMKALVDPEYGVIKDTKEITAVGHRVLHGGTTYSDSIVVNEDVKRVIRECFDLGPLHNPANLMGIEACEKAMPGTPNVAVWDTGFGMKMDEKAYLYAIPYEYYEKYSIRRYGFHGTSHMFVSGEALKFAGLDPEKGKVIVCHLGNGASISASIGGKCVDTSMGLTPLEGLIMGTRSGDIDPAVVQFICNKEGKDVNEVLNILNKKSGVLGMSDGVSSDFRDVGKAAECHTCTYGALGAFSTGVGSTDMAAGMATGKAWFKVPSAIRFNLIGKPSKWVSGKDVILHIIGMIGVDGALYKSMEFAGEGVAELSMDDRFTIANMAIEAGGKNGIFPVDEKAAAYMKEHSKREYKVYEADEDAEYEQEFTIDLSTLKSTVAFPHLPENTKTVDEIAEDVAIDQVVIGSCTNGRMDDLRAAAEILKGRKVKKGVRCIVIPGTQKIYLDAMEEGLLKIFLEAGAVVSTPTCGPCLGGYMGILAAGERCVSTTNRNFVGRMGHVESEVYLASPAVAAASAVTGKISAPAELGL